MSELTPVQESYFATLRRLDLSPQMERTIASAIERLQRCDDDPR